MNSQLKGGTLLIERTTCTIAAIEHVFRETHHRLMTSAERKFFDLPLSTEKYEMAVEHWDVKSVSNAIAPRRDRRGSKNQIAIRLTVAKEPEEGQIFFWSRRTGRIQRF